ncbi:hypothetical protein TNIN_208421, partial [Trichonephila inaurata madagascariensis]
MEMRDSFGFNTPKLEKILDPNLLRPLAPNFSLARWENLPKKIPKVLKGSEFPEWLFRVSFG